MDAHKIYLREMVEEVVYNDTYFNISQCAKYLNKHRHTIKKAIDNGHIKCVRVGGSYSIPKIQFKR